MNKLKLAHSCFNCKHRSECKPSASLSEWIKNSCDKYEDNPEKYYKGE